MTETDMTPAPPHERDLRTLLDQIVAGVVAVEEMLDAASPDWDAPRRGRRRSQDLPASTGALLSARGQFVTAWTNLAHVLVQIPGVEPWSITPLVTRDTASGGYDVWQFDPNGNLDLTHGHEPPSPPDECDVAPVRPVPQPTEPRYTLDEARRILQAEHAHTWSVVLDGDEPVAVQCTGTDCDETRAMP